MHQALKGLNPNTILFYSTRTGTYVRAWNLCKSRVGSQFCSNSLFTSEWQGPKSLISNASHDFSCIRCLINSSVNWTMIDQCMMLSISKNKPITHLVLSKGRANLPKPLILRLYVCDTHTVPHCLNLTNMLNESLRSCVITLKFICSPFLYTHLSSGVMR